MKRFLFVLGLIREHLWSYALGAVLLGATLWMTFAIPRYLQEAIDILARDPDPSGRSFLDRIAWIVAFAIAVVVTRTGSRLLFFVPGRRVEFDLKNRLLVHLARLQRGFYLDNPSGAIISRLNNDINGVRMLLGAGLMMLISSVGTLSFAPYYMYQISPRLTLYCALPVILGFLAVQAGIRRLRRDQQAQMSSLRHLSDFTVESYSGIDVLKSYRTAGWAHAKFEGLSHEVRDAAIRMSTVRAYLMPLLLHIANALKVLLLMVGGSLVVAAEMSIGQFTAYTLYLSMIVPPLMGMTFMLFVMQRGMTSLGSLIELFDAQPGVPPPDPQARLPVPLAQGLSVSGLRFAYPDEPQRAVLDAVSFDLAPGEVVGVYGGVGSGKTTLTNLLNYYLEPPPGTVRLEGVDVRALGQAAVRERVVTVTQDAFLFSDTIRENVAFAAPGVEEGAVREALTGAALDADLARMPAGLDTVVGEKGITLSGGQRQRVSLARALLRPCEILILDDVLSAVDHETERYLIERIYRRPGAGGPARATLLISHRISALERADRVLVLERGRIVAEGRHQALIARDGPYRDAWRLQTEEGTADDDAPPAPSTAVPRPARDR